jgi:ribonuclease T1
MNHLRRRATSLTAGLIALVGLVGGAGLAGCAAKTDAAPANAAGVATSAVTDVPGMVPSAAPDAAPAPAPGGAGLAPTQPTTSLRTIKVSELPPEGRTTLTLIAKDGPFPYKQDGVVFQNRERILPKRPNGFYNEYTVKTPGSPDRGARRIVTGEDGSRFYTSDHYDSFREVVTG